MSNKLEFPLTLGLQKTDLPLIVTSDKLKNLCFLIDTGATHNVLFIMYLNISEMNLGCLMNTKAQWHRGKL